MGIELTINKELAGLTFPLIELVSADKAIRSLVKNAEFLNALDELKQLLINCYQVIPDNIDPWLSISSEELFIREFDERYATYQANFLKEASKPRTSVENTYEKHQLLKSLKEYKSGFPLLKRGIGRFDDYMDKWIDNDSWLMLNIDGAFKMLNRLLLEIAEYKKKDPEEAYIIFASAFSDFSHFLTIIRKQLGSLKE